MAILKKFLHNVCITPKSRNFKFLTRCQVLVALIEKRVQYILSFDIIGEISYPQLMCELFVNIIIFIGDVHNDHFLESVVKVLLIVIEW